MKKINRRSFNSLYDIKKLQIFLSEMRNLVSPAGYFHLGDLIFRTNKESNNFDILKDIQIWEKSGIIIGFVLYLTTESNPEFQINPDYYNTIISKDMIVWTIERAKELNLNSIEVSCLDIDKKKNEFLLANNFKPFDAPIVFMQRDLKNIPEYKLPVDYSFVTINDFPKTTQITGEESSNKENKNIIKSDKYNDDLGIRVIHKNVQIVSGCICWYDEVDKCGLFEPVGTIEEHRGKGLAFSAMVRTLLNLKNYGANKVYVRTGLDNTPAINLYKKLGFSISNYDNGFELDLNNI
ncbi:GNAT family N-acetyltransferase [Thiospirochaeta perfilievii]|uniref:GNAT family N-acetyltransferase n=1 Tax=Thiospirochaeta perfilievii TaxID=252967 RepID=A0A5C1QI84_9SPIO|nr:GNAT family N-acetyltransferase [Thiospirochaeta perfilievii]QEN06244.1 GNAT family N-acetyltransferase [Thiospirochaeta perfilievii]